MRNIFLVYIPPGNAEAMVHYEETIRQKVSPERIYRYVGADLRGKLMRIFGGRPITVWGSQNSSANRSKFERMVSGDEILIIEGATIKLLGKIAAVTVSSDLSRELWKNIRPTGDMSWDLIYFIANPQEIDLPFKEFCSLMDYEPNYQLRGLATVSYERLEKFYDQYDDLYSILIQRKRRQKIYQVPKAVDHISQPDCESKPSLVSSQAEELKEALPEETISDHVRMQWKLINLGIKASSRVWVPAGDQSRIRKLYDFDQFETDFAAGLDTQVRYVENIDVVWKEEFRIDAAFEIENTTSIYSGLLRFSDLTLVAPNTIYPLFIVAPQDKRAPKGAAT